MGILDWLLMALPDHVSPKEPKNDEGVVQRVLGHFRDSAKRADERAEQEEATKDEAAQELFDQAHPMNNPSYVRALRIAHGHADANHGMQQHLANDQISLKVMVEKDRISEALQAEEKESPTAGFDSWLAQQHDEPASADLPPAVKDFILNPELPASRNDYEPS